MSEQAKRTYERLFPREPACECEALRARLATVTECNESMRAAMLDLRTMVAMPAEGEGAVLDAVARKLRKTLLYSSELSAARARLALAERVVEAAREAIGPRRCVNALIVLGTALDALDAARAQP